MLGAGYPMYPRAGDWHRSCPACRLATHHSSMPPVESLIPERHTLELMALPGGNGGKALGSSWDRGRLHWGQWLCRAGWCWNVAIPRALLSAAKPWLYLAQVRPQLGAIGSPCPPAAPPHSVLPFPSASLQPPPASPPTLQHSHIFLGLSSFFPLPSLLAANFPSCCPPPLPPHRLPLQGSIGHSCRTDSQHHVQQHQELGHGAAPRTKAATRREQQLCKHRQAGERRVMRESPAFNRDGKTSPWALLGCTMLAAGGSPCSGCGANGNS